MIARFLKIAFIVSVFLTAIGLNVSNTCWASQRNVLSSLGNFVSPISLEEERTVGAEMDKATREKYKVSDNLALQRYVNSVGQKLVAVSGQEMPFSYAVLVDDQTQNAFSGPGGYVYITTGLIAMLDNESQLAAVLAHETGHCLKRHVVKQLQEKKVTNTALALLGQFAHRNVDNQFTQVGQLLLYKRFSRQDEFEADVVGTQLLARAGYTPYGMTQLLQKLIALDARGIPLTLLQSHPSSAARLNLIKSYIAKNHLERPGQLTDTPAFHRVIH